MREAGEIERVDLDRNLSEAVVAGEARAGDALWKNLRKSGRFVLLAVWLFAFARVLEAITSLERSGWTLMLTCVTCAVCRRW